MGCSGQRALPQWAARDIMPRAWQWQRRLWTGFLLGMQANGFRLLRVPLDCAQRGVYLLKARRERPPPVSGGGGSASSTSSGKAPLSELSAPPGRRALLLSCTLPRPRRWRVRGSAAAQRAEDARHGCVPLDVDALLRVTVRELAGGDC